MLRRCSTSLAFTKAADARASQDHSSCKSAPELMHAPGDHQRLRSCDEHVAAAGALTTPIRRSAMPAGASTKCRSRTPSERCLTRH
jgi:hypothetical protein